MTTDLFELMGRSAMTPAERRAITRKGPKPSGYAYFPGTGPEGETCGSCRHIERHRRWAKCGLYPTPTAGRGTDIHVRSPACKRWEKACP
jgi:hypothetical protein